MPPACRHVRLGSVGSTLDEAEKLLASGEGAHGTLLTAHIQTQGRGRLGCSWASPPGNLYASLILRPEKPVAGWPQISFIMALALADAIASLLPAKPVSLKWPNDVLVGDKKISGLMLMRASTHDGADALIIGFGVNCATHPEGTPYGATSLAAEGSSIAPEAVLAPILHAFDKHYRTWLEGGFAPIRAAWLTRARGMGGPVTVKDAARSFSGVFMDIDADGALLVKTADGALVRVMAGDVYFTTPET